MYGQERSLLLEHYDRSAVQEHVKKWYYRIKAISLHHGTVKEIYQAVEAKNMQWEMTWSKAKVNMRSREVLIPKTIF